MIGAASRVLASVEGVGAAIRSGVVLEQLTFRDRNSARCLDVCASAGAAGKHGIS